MMIDSELLRERLNHKSAIPWHENDRSTNSYKQGFLSGLIKALVIVGEVEYLTKYGHDRPPVELELDEETTEGLKTVMGAINDKIKELEITSHSEKDIVEACIGLMESVHGIMMEYMEMMDVEHTEGIPVLNYSYFEIVQTLLLQRTRHSGGTSTRAKCEQLGFDSYERIVIGERGGE